MHPLPCACPCQGFLQPRRLLISRCPTDLNVLMGFLANRHLKTRQTGLQSTGGLDAVLRWDGTTGTRLTTPASTPRVINEPPTNSQPRPGPQHLPCVLLRAGSHPVSPRGRRPWYRWRDRRSGRAISLIRWRVSWQPVWCQRCSTAGTRQDVAAGRGRPLWLRRSRRAKTPTYRAAGCAGSGDSVGPLAEVTGCSPALHQWTGGVWGQGGVSLMIAAPSWLGGPTPQSLPTQSCQPQLLPARHASPPGQPLRSDGLCPWS